MRQDAWRAYLEMALGVTEASGKKALKTAKRLVGRSGVSADQLQGMADELVRASAANREAVRNLVRVELDRALNAVGLAKADEVETLTARVRELEAQLQASKAAEPAGGDDGPVPSALAKKTVAKKAVAKKAVAPAEPKANGAAKAAPAKKATKAAPSAIGDEITAPAPGPAGPEPRGAVPTKAVPAKKAVKKAARKAVKKTTTEQTP